MLNMAIGVLWFLVGLIILCGIIWLAIWVIEQFIMAIPEQIKKGIWVIVLLLALIALMTVVAGGGIGSLRGPSFRIGESSGTTPAVPFNASSYMYGMLTR